MPLTKLKQSKRLRVLVGIVTVIVILAVTIPIIFIIVRREQQKANMVFRSDVLVPLYVYPSPGAWSPLHDAITEYPDTHFTVIVNPSSGPGDGSVPDGNYTAEIPKLTSQPNVRVLGYVATTYSKRDVLAVLRDVATYSAWSENAAHPGLGVKGIFFDETPNEYSARSVQYLESLTEAVKNSTGLGPDHYVIHNPGSIPDRRYMPSADCTVVFEDTYRTFQDRNSAKTLLALPDNRSQLCFAMHSIPPTISKGNFKGLVRDVRKVAGSVFMTDLSIDYYASFSNRWAEFVQDMA